MAGVLAAWKAIQGRRPAIRTSGKFKPDITPFCAKIDDDAKKFAQLDEAKKKAEKIIDVAGEQMNARAQKIAAKTDELSKLNAEIEASLEKDIDLSGPNAAKDVSQTATTLEGLAKKRAALTQEIVKLSDEHAKLAKSAAAQFKATRDGIDAGQKKLSADGLKMAAEIKRLVVIYQKIATGMKDPAMAADIGTLPSVDPG